MVEKEVELQSELEQEQELEQELEQEAELEQELESELEIEQEAEFDTEPEPGCEAIQREGSVERGQKARRTPKGSYQISANGNSKAVNCIRVLDEEDVPNEFGDLVTVIMVEDPQRGTYLEIVPKGTGVQG